MKLRSRILAWIMTFMIIFGTMPNNIWQASAAEVAPSLDDLILTKTAKETTNGSVKDEHGNVLQTYDINLGVKGSNVTQNFPLDVTLVIDLSNSMTNGNRPNNLDVTKAAARGFLDSIFADANNQTRVAIVAYATEGYAYDFGETRDDWDRKWDKYTEINNSSGTYYTSNKDVAKGVIDNSKFTNKGIESDTGGTNTEAGFLTAKAVTESRNRSDAKSVVVFMTDGIPTFYYNSKNEVKGTGSDASEYTFNQAVDAALDLKDDGNIIYTVGLLTTYSEGSDELEMANKLLSDVDSYKYSTKTEAKTIECTRESNSDHWKRRMNGTYYHDSNKCLQKDGKYYYTSNVTTNVYTALTDEEAYSSKYYNVTSADNAASTLNDIYAQIAQEVKSLATGSVTDVIPKDFIITNKAELEAAGVIVDMATNTVTYKNVSAGVETTNLPTIKVQYNGDNYGSAYTNSSATFKGTFYDNSACEKAFPAPVAGLDPQTINDTASTKVNTQITIYELANDYVKDQNKLEVSGYTVSNVTVILTDEEGEPIVDEDGNSVIDDGDIIVTVNEDGTFNFVSKTAGTKEFYYVLKANVTLPSNHNYAIDNDVELTSRVTKVTVNVAKAIKVTKVWEDSDNQDGLRTNDVQIQLYADDVATGAPIVLSDANNWTHTWENVDGTKTYTVKETSVPEGYSVSYGGDENSGFVVTNTHIPRKTEVSVIKSWVDNNNQDGMRTDFVQVQLYAGNEPIGVPVALSNTNNWTHTWNNLPFNKEGNKIEYTVNEIETPEGYTQTVAQNPENNQFTITNKHTPEKVSFTVTKVWDDNNNDAGKRPGSVTVQLKANGKDVGDPVTLNNSNSWEYKWENLEKYKAGSEITYTVEETSDLAKLNYSSEVTGNTESGFEITNTYPAVRDISVKKVWNDKDNQDGFRPADVTVQLKADGENYGEAVKVTNTYKWENLFKYKTDAKGDVVVDEKGNPVEIKYTVDEVEVPEYYTKEVEGTMADGFKITNTHIPETTEATVEKVWDDNNNQDGIRPTELRVTLSDGTEVTLNESNEWTATVKDLPKYADGEEIEYTWTEVEAPAGYTQKEPVVTTTEDGKGTITTLINSHPPATVDFKGNKQWVEANGYKDLRPESVTIKLTGTVLNNEGETVTVVEKTTTATKGTLIDGILNNDWTWSFVDQPEKYQGQKINYTVSELAVPGYTTSIDKNAEGIYTVTNTLDTVNIYGSKVWNDNENQDGNRRDSVEIKLYNGGEEPVATTTATSANNWEWAFKDVPKYKVVDGKAVEIDYTVNETQIPGYTPNIVKNSDGAYVVTNTQNKVAINGTKVWEDEGLTAFRPESVTITLLANGSEVLGTDGSAVTTVASAATNWNWSFTDLPEYKNGEKVEYSVSESVPGYTTNIVKNNNGTYTVTNTVNTTSVSGEKTWNDKNNQDGKRPSTVTINLIGTVGEGTNLEKVYTKTFDVKAPWTYEVTGLPTHDAEGREITYKVTEVNVPEYQTAVSGTDVSNSYTPAKTSVTVTKVWDDDGNRDALRPSDVTVKLTGTIVADGETKTVYTNEQTITPGEDDTWSYTWENLDLKAEGKTIDYTVEEPDVPEGYTSVVDGYTITNFYEAETVDFEGIKTWDDFENQYNLRPDSAVIQLIADGKLVDSYEVSNENEWKWSFNDLPKNKNVDGKAVAIKYEIKEVPVPGYTTDITQDDETKAYTVTNILETVKVEGSKNWNDDNNAKGNRPDEITINLFADGNLIDSKVVDDSDNSNNWAYSFTDLPKYKSVDDQLVEIVYSVDENAVTGYKKDIDGYNITNTPTTVTVDGTKIWNDNNAGNNNRPSNIIVTLTGTITNEDGGNVIVVGGAADPYQVSVTPNAAGEWNYAFNNLPEYVNGQKVNYTVTEGIVPGYESDVDANNNVINTETKTSISGEKIWNDADNQDGNRPDRITVNLLENGNTVASQTLSAGEDKVWQSEELEYTFTDLPTHKNGQPVVYTVSEAPVNGYSTSYSEDTYKITNSYTPGKTSVTVNKIWEDADNQDGIRPVSITVQLKANGVAKGDAVTLNEANKWTYTWENLDLKAKGQVIDYDVVETSELPKGYTSTSKEVGNTTTITNSYTPQVTDISGEKIWADSNNKGNIRPESVTINLLANGEFVKATEVSEDTNWKYIFTNLPVKANGNSIEYTIEEVEVPGYATVINGYNVTNTLITTDIFGSKEWNDSNNAHKNQPSEITIELFADNEKVKDANVKADTNGKWNFEFRGLPKYTLDAEGNAKEINYTVKELAVPGYDTAIDGFKVTNTLQTTSISGEKVWKDTEKTAGYRPDSITINLLANGKIVDTKTVTADNNWAFEFTDLPVYKEKAKVTYTIDEVEVPGYEKVITGDAENGYEVTNTLQTTSVSGEKVWDDANNQDGKRPKSIVVKLLEDGQVVASKTVNEKDGWKYSFTDLPTHKKGVEIEYTVNEEPVAEYSTSYSKAGYDITNSYTPGKTSVTVNKVWDDANNQDGIRPPEIDVTLTGTIEVDGNKTTVYTDTQTIKPNADGNWSYAWADLAEKSAGKTILYRVTEESVRGYETTYSEDGYTIINRHAPETVDFEGRKVWNNDADGVHPDSVTIMLTGKVDQETVVSLTTTASKASNWTWEFKDQPKYKAGAQGKEIVYTIDEVEVPGYDKEITKDEKLDYVITNTLRTGTATIHDSVKVNKVDQDGNALKGATFGLFTDSECKGTAFTTFTGGEFTINTAAVALEDKLPAVGDEDGVTYYLKETAAPGGYTASEEIYDVVITAKESKAMQTVDNVVKYITTTTYTITIDGAETATVTNKIIPAEIKLGVDKTLVGREWTEDERFEFTLAAAAGNVAGATLPEDTTVTVGENSGTVEFDAINFVKEGTYTFTISETGDLPAKVDRPEAQTVTVNVAKDNAGQLVATVAEGSRQTVEFTNVYTPDPATATIKANKTVTPADKFTMKAGDFEFEIAAAVTNSEGCPLATDEDHKITVTNKADGSIPIDTWTFTKAGTYEYTIREAKSNRAGIRLDGTVYTIVVTVTDDPATGKLSTDVEYKNGKDVVETLTFNNVYDPEDVTANISGYKTLDGGHKPLEEGEFTFELIPLDGAPAPEDRTTTTTVSGLFQFEFEFGEAAYTMPGTYQYKIKEVVEEAKDGYTYDTDEIVVSVVVTDSGNGILKAEVQNAAEIKFQNKYVPNEIAKSVAVTKELTGREWKEDDFFEFTMAPTEATQAAIEAGNVVMPEDTTVTVTKASSEYSESFEEITFKKAGEYTFTVTETKGELGGVTYDTTPREITFTVTDEGYDGQLDVSVSKEDADKLTFINKYTPKEVTLEGAANLKVNKALTGRQDGAWLDTDTFTFGLEAKAEATMEAVEAGKVVMPEDKEVTVTSEDREAAFGNIVFKEAGTYQFEITEGKSDIPGVTNDNNSVRIITVSVVDDTNGKLVATVDAENSEDLNYENKYATEPAKVKLGAAKVLTGRDLKAGEFSFKLVDENGKEIEIVTNTAEGKVNFSELTYDEAGTYKYTISEVQGDLEGVAYDETVHEVTVTVVDNNEGKLIATTSDNAAHITFNNVYTIKVEGEKVWNDDDNKYGNRPDSITVNLLADGEKVDEQTVTAENDWAYSFENLTVHNDNGEEIEYTVTEELVDGYTTEIEGRDIINTTATTAVSGSKVWNDADNQDGMRPQTVTINLIAQVAGEDGEMVTVEDLAQSKSVTAATNWKWSFEELPAYFDGKEVIYSITEDAVAEYTSKIVKGENGEYTVTNSHKPEKVSVSGTKIWNDANNQDGKRPESVTIHLQKNGEIVDTKVVTEEDNWKYTFSDLDKYEDGGKLIDYAIVEEAVEEYSTTYNGYDVVNGYTPGQTSVTVTKVWDDNNNQDGLRTNDITVKLLADGEETGKKVVLNSGNSWTASFTELDLMAAGEMIDYTVAEEAVPAGYEVTIEETAENSNIFTITNTHEPAVTDITGSKTWDDADNQDGFRPESITINLLADGKVKETKKVTAADEWAWSFTNLDKYRDGGVEIVYTITENAVANYEIEIDGYDVTNSHEPGKTTVTVTKAWDDADDQDGIRPEKVKVQLYADDVAYGKAVELDAAKAWTYTWNGLDQKKAGKDIEYTVKEVDTAAGYIAAISGNQTEGYVITNTHTPETTSVSGSKTWKDADNQDGIRPESIMINLLADGKVKETKKVTAADEWAWSFTNLDKYRDGGVEIVYTITENAVANYEIEIDGYDVTNSYEPGKTTVTVTKAWDDADDQDGIRPEKVKVQLYADDVVYGEVVELNAAKAWTYTWNGLDQKKAGQDIEYTVKEVDTATGYIAAISGNQTEGYVITNTHTPETTSVSGSKTWNDNDDQDGKRPASITINLLANGEKVDQKTVTADDNWTWKFTGLDKYADGKEIVYTVTEEAVAGYVSEVNGFDVINTAKTPVSAVIGGMKVLENAELTAGQFEFGLYNESDELIGTAVNGADGTFAFDEITYNEEGTFVYFIKEMIPEDAEELEPGTFVVDGILYDTAVFKYTVTVAEEDDSYAVTSEAIQVAEGDNWTDCGTIEFKNEDISGGDDDDGGNDPGEENPPVTPEPPNTPDTPDDDPLTDEDEDGNVQTGDNFSMFLWIMIALTGALGAAGAARFRRREN